MKNEILEVNINPMQITSIVSFTNINGRFNDLKKDVYFIRYIGIEEEQKYISEILNMDKQLNDRKNINKIGYLRVDNLDSRLDINNVEYYSNLYNEWAKGSNENKKLNIKFKFDNLLWQNTLEITYWKMLKLYKQIGTNINESMLKNFGVKLLYWIDLYFPKVFINISEIVMSPKFVFTGNIKNQEYIFLYFLVLLGADVLYLNSEKDIIASDELLKLSYRYIQKCKKIVSIPSYDINNTTKSFNSENTRVVNESNQLKVSLNLINEKRKSKENVNVARSKPLEYEELAKLASSVVMIGVHDRNNKCFKTGSGVIISSKGYILTNFHVACEGAYYGIRLEDEQEVYETSEIIKYNQVYDLAILRIDKKCTPIPIYQSENALSRGQKVVAIGSPLGLFNSVSDGIIAGFRNLDDVSMVQFTAPISHGSSGGALLDLYGRLVGIITAGFDDGQNLNLAVDHKAVLNFVRGFI